MGNAWFRCYSEILDDAKVQMMTKENQRHLLMLFALRCEGNALETFHETQIAFRLRISPEELLAIKPIFIENGFIDKQWNILNWDKRQYLSDSSTARVRQYRERMKQDETLHGANGTLQKQPVTEVVTAPEQNRTDTEQNRAEQKELSLLSPLETKERKIRPEDFANEWNKKRGKLPKVERFTESRKRKTRTRMDEGLTLERFSEAVENCISKPFLSGDNETGWTATFDWLVENDKNLEKAINNPYGLNHKDGNGRNNAAVPNGTGGNIMGMVFNSINRGKHQSPSRKNGDLPSVVKTGRSDVGIVHASVDGTRHEGLSGSNEESFVF